MNCVKTDIDNRIAWVKISRGDGRNAFSQKMMLELRDTARMLQDVPDLTAVVLSSDGAFSAGADLSDSDGIRQDAGLLEMRQAIKLGPDMCKAWEDIDAYTIAAIEQYCIGGASALVASMDYRVMGAGSHMRLPEIGLGINMSWQTIPRLVAQIGPARAKQYTIMCEKINAVDAFSWGLIEQISQDGGAFDEAVRIAQKVASLPPLAVKMTKKAINATAYALADATSYMDRDQYLLTVQTEDFQEAMTAFFEKRAPEFTGN